MWAKQRRKILATVLIVGAVAAIGMTLFFRKEPEPVTFRIMTATDGGTYYELGEQFSAILNTLPGGRIKEATAEHSQGSVDNIYRLLSPKSGDGELLAFVMEPALVEAKETGAEEELRILTRLYTDVVQIVVRRNSGIHELADLKGKKIYIGPKQSATWIAAKRILDAKPSVDDYTPEVAKGFADAVGKLMDQESDLKAVFVAAGTPTKAVQTALESDKCNLLSLDKARIEELTTRKASTEGEADHKLVSVEVPANKYPNQDRSINTVGANVFLVCRKDLDEELAGQILEVLFDNITDLFLAHTKAQDIRFVTVGENLELVTAFDKLPDGFQLHPGAKRFREDEEKKLLIATGAINGKYYNIGRKIQLLLKQHGVLSRVLHTDGSFENVELLRKSKRPTLAIMHYDAALAALFGDKKLVYGENSYDAIGQLPDIRRFSQLPDIRRIATLHEEKVHVIVRRDKLKEIEDADPESEKIRTLEELADALTKLSPKEKKPLSICLGPERSATRVLAEAILIRHRIESDSYIPSYMSVPDMVNRLHNDEIDAGVFVSYVPSAAVKSILQSEKVALLSLGSRERAEMTDAVFTTDTINAGTYACQNEDEPIQTIATRAVLVTTEDLPFNVKHITKAIFEGRAFLEIMPGEEQMAQEAREEMAQDLPSLPLHRDAIPYYKEKEYLPPDPSIVPVDWLKAAWYVLAMSVILIGGYRGFIEIKRTQTSNTFCKRILAIAVGAEEPDSVDKLNRIGREILERTQMNYWHWGELDKSRWQYLDDLIDGRKNTAKDITTRTILGAILSVAQDSTVDAANKQQHNSAIRQDIMLKLEQGELDRSHKELLLAVLQEIGQHGDGAGR